MPLRIAIAWSATDKAKSVTEAGEIITIQQYFSLDQTSWFHVWVVKNGGLDEMDIKGEELEETLELIYRFKPMDALWVSM